MLPPYVVSMDEQTRATERVLRERAQRIRDLRVQIWEEEAEVVALCRAAGWSWNRISRQVDTSVSTLIRRYAGDETEAS
jgi:hypothetical protein